jgi:hypothetical protein
MGIPSFTEAGLLSFIPGFHLGIFSNTLTASASQALQPMQLLATKAFFTEPSFSTVNSIMVLHGFAKLSLFCNKGFFKLVWMNFIISVGPPGYSGITSGLEMASLFCENRFEPINNTSITRICFILLPYWFHIHVNDALGLTNR